MTRDRKEMLDEDKAQARREREGKVLLRQQQRDWAAQVKRTAQEAKRARDLALLAEVTAAKAAGSLRPSPKPKRVKPAPHGQAPVLGTRSVPDPYEPGARITARVNLAEHPLEMMLSRGRLDPALYEAGVRYRAIWERAVIGPGRGVDPSRVKVDGGVSGDSITDAVAHAHLELKRLSVVLGMVGEQVVSRVAGEGVPVADLAARWPGPEQERTKRDYLTMRLKEGLDVLASEVWGARGPERSRMRGARDLGSGHVDEQAVAVANQTALRKRGITGLS